MRDHAFHHKSTAGLLCDASCLPRLPAMNLPTARLISAQFRPRHLNDPEHIANTTPAGHTVADTSFPPHKTAAPAYGISKPKPVSEQSNSKHPST